MSKIVKLAVIRAQHDAGVAGLADRDVREMFFANTDNSAVFQFWEQAFYDLSQSTLVTKTVSFVIDFEKTDDRSDLAKHVYDKLTSEGEDLSSYDGFVFLVWPGGNVTVNNPRAGEPNQPATITRTIDGGSNNFSDGRKFCVLPVGSSDHTFFCHEVGHVIGMEHTFGVLNNGIDWNGTGATGNVYGDPYDIMSSASFGARGSGPITWNSNPTFAGTPVSWPNANAFQMGCAPARANAHFFNEQHYSTNELFTVPLPTGSLQHTRRLYRANGGAGNQQLLLIRPPNEGADRIRRCYVEYRDNAGWDRGLADSGTDLDRRGVVVHTVANSSDGSRVWYRGNIFLPLEIDGDFSPPDVPLTITLMGVGPNRDYVDVRVSASVSKGLIVDHYEEDEEVDAISETVQVKIPCGRVRYGTYLLRHTSRFVPFIFGYGDPTAEGVPAVPPLLRWTVGGVVIPSGPSSGSIAVAKVGGGSATVRYDMTIDGSLTIVAESNQGAFKSLVNCTVTEADGSSPTSEDLELSTLGQYTGVRRIDQALLKECMRKVLVRVRIRRRDLLLPPGPNPYRDRAHDRENLARIRLIANSLREEHMGVAHDLRRLGTLLFARELV